MSRVVLDTNVLVSWVIALGYSAQILESARQNKITLVTSPHLLDLKAYKEILVLTPREIVEQVLT
jgi:predicted nucleic acid-binding protein